jgi:DNA-binding GntR family transcriptional regulator
MSARERVRDESRTTLEEVRPPVGADAVGALPATNIVTTSLSGQAYRRIKDLLLDGQLKPGTRISSREAAQALGISVTPLREALLQLAAEQSLVPGRGRTIEVPPLDVAHCRELWEIRLQLEPFCAEAALARMNASIIERLEAANAQMLAAKQRRDVDGGLLFNRQFHFLLYGTAEMPTLTWIIECVWAQAGAYVRHFLDHHVKTRNDASVQGPHVHGTILNALRRGDAAGLTAGLQRDLIEVRDGILQVLTAGPPGQAEQPLALIR